MSRGLKASQKQRRRPRLNSARLSFKNRSGYATHDRSLIFSWSLSENPVFCCNRIISAAAPNGSNSPYLRICLVFRRGASLEILRFRDERGFPDKLYFLALPFDGQCFV